MSPESDPSGNQNRGLHQCPECPGDMVQPVRWEQTQQRGQWRVWLRCPDCEWRDDGVYGELEIDKYDNALDEATQELGATLKQLERENMQTLADAIAEGLARDLIGPDDFRN